MHSCYIIVCLLWTIIVSADVLQKPNEDTKEKLILKNNVLQVADNLNITKGEEESLKNVNTDVWKVQDQSENGLSSCILLQGKIEFKVFSDLGTISVKIPQNATADGNCVSLWKDYQDIKLSWTSIDGNNSNILNNSMYFGFATDWDSQFSELSIGEKEYALNTVTVVYHGRTYTSKKMTLMSYSASDFIAFRTPKNQSYFCPSENRILLGDLELTISDFRLQAFKSVGEGSSFSTSAVHCSTETDDEKGTMYYILEITKWFFLVAFALCLIGALLVLLVGIVQKRQDIMNFGYRLLGST